MLMLAHLFFWFFLVRISIRFVKEVNQEATERQ